MTTRPTLTDVREAIGVPATALPDDQLQRIYDAHVADQETRLTIPTDADAFPEPLASTFIRRIQRWVAAGNLPLGMVGVDAEYGARTLPMTDALIDQLERPFARQVLA